MRMQMSWKPLEIQAHFQLDINRKWHMANQMVTLSMTSSDLERSRAWPQYVWDPLSRKWLDIQTRLVTMVTRVLITNGTWGIKWSCDQWCHVTLKAKVWLIAWAWFNVSTGQGRDPDIRGAIKKFSAWPSSVQNKIKILFASYSSRA